MDVANLANGDLIGLLGVLAIAGIAAGFLSGLFGIGGGSILVPVLYMAFGAVGIAEDVRMQLTLGTSFAVIAPTGLRSYLAHRARGHVDQGAFRRLAPWVFAGVIAGVVIAGMASGAALRWVWVFAASAMAVKLAFGRDDWKLGDRLPPSWGIETTAFAIGLLSALMSIGGGLFMVSFLMLFGYAVLPAIATSSGFGPLIAVTGLIGFAITGWTVGGLPAGSIGYVNLVAAFVMLPASLAFAPLGVRVAHGVPRRVLELAFAAYLTLVALKFLWTLL